MESRYPLFENGRILKKEALEILRDYPREMLSILYEGYTDGVIRGLRIRVDQENHFLILSRGLVKLQNEVYPISQEIKIPYTHTEKREYLKLRRRVLASDKDWETTGIEAFLSAEESGEGEILLCSFLLKSGFVLRDTYLNFSDMRSEYDTIHLMNGTYAGYGETTFSIEVLKVYAKEYLATKQCEEGDRTFCYMVLHTVEGVHRSIIENYIAMKEGRGTSSRLSNTEIYTRLLDILRSAKTLEGYRRPGFSPKKILVD